MQSRAAALMGGPDYPGMPAQFRDIPLPTSDPRQSSRPASALSQPQPRLQVKGSASPGVPAFGRSMEITVDPSVTASAIYPVPQMVTFEKGSSEEGLSFLTESGNFGSDSIKLTRDVVLGLLNNSLVIIKESMQRTREHFWSELFREQGDAAAERQGMSAEARNADPRPGAAGPSLGGDSVTEQVAAYKQRLEQFRAMFARCLEQGIGTILQEEMVKLESKIPDYVQESMVREASIDGTPVSMSDPIFVSRYVLALKHVVTSKHKESCDRQAEVVKLQKKLQQKAALIEKLRATLFKEIVTLREELFRKHHDGDAYAFDVFSIFDIISLLDQSQDEEEKSSRAMRVQIELLKKMKDEQDRMRSTLEVNFKRELDKKDRVILRLRAQLESLQGGSGKLPMDISMMSTSRPGSRRTSSQILFDDMDGADDMEDGFGHASTMTAAQASHMQSEMRRRKAAGSDGKNVGATGTAGATKVVPGKKSAGSPGAVAGAATGDDGRRPKETAMAVAQALAAVQQVQVEAGKQIANYQQQMSEQARKLVDAEHKAVDATQRAQDFDRQVQDLRAELQREKAERDALIAEMRQQATKDIARVRRELAKKEAEFGEERALLQSEAAKMVSQARLDAERSQAKLLRTMSQMQQEKANMRMELERVNSTVSFEPAGSDGSDLDEENKEDANSTKPSRKASVSLEVEKSAGAKDPMLDSLSAIPGLSRQSSVTFRLESGSVSALSTSRMASISSTDTSNAAGGQGTSSPDRNAASADAPKVKAKKKPKTAGIAAVVEARANRSKPASAAEAPAIPGAKGATKPAKADSGAGRDARDQGRVEDLKQQVTDLSAEVTGLKTESSNLREQLRLASALEQSLTDALTRMEEQLAVEQRRNLATSVASSSSKALGDLARVAASANALLKEHGSDGSPQNAPVESAQPVAPSIATSVKQAVVAALAKPPASDMAVQTEAVPPSPPPPPPPPPPPAKEDLHAVPQRHASSPLLDEGPELLPGITRTFSSDIVQSPVQPSASQVPVYTTPARPEMLSTSVQTDIVPERTATPATQADVLRPAPQRHLHGPPAPIPTPAGVSMSVAGDKALSLAPSVVFQVPVAAVLSVEQFIQTSEVVAMQEDGISAVSVDDAAVQTDLRLGTDDDDRVVSLGSSWVSSRRTSLQSPASRSSRHGQQASASFDDRSSSSELRLEPLRLSSRNVDGAMSDSGGPADAVRSEDIVIPSSSSLRKYADRERQAGDRGSRPGSGSRRKLGDPVPDPVPMELPTQKIEFGVVLPRLEQLDSVLGRRPWSPKFSVKASRATVMREQQLQSYRERISPNRIRPHSADLEGARSTGPSGAGRNRPRSAKVVRWHEFVGERSKVWLESPPSATPPVAKSSAAGGSGRSSPMLEEEDHFEDTLVGASSDSPMSRRSSMRPAPTESAAGRQPEILPASGSTLSRPRRQGSPTARQPTETYRGEFIPSMVVAQLQSNKARNPLLVGGLEAGATAQSPADVRHPTGIFGYEYGSSTAETPAAAAAAAGFELHVTQLVEERRPTVRAARRSEDDESLSGFSTETGPRTGQWAPMSVRSISQERPSSSASSMVARRRLDVHTMRAAAATQEGGPRDSDGRRPEYPSTGYRQQPVQFSDAVGSSVVTAGITAEAAVKAASAIARTSGDEKIVSTASFVGPQDGGSAVKIKTKVIRRIEDPARQHGMSTVQLWELEHNPLGNSRLQERRSPSPTSLRPRTSLGFPRQNLAARSASPTQSERHDLGPVTIQSMSSVTYTDVLVSADVDEFGRHRSKISPRVQELGFAVDSMEPYPPYAGVLPNAVPQQIKAKVLTPVNPAGRQSPPQPSTAGILLKEVMAGDVAADAASVSAVDTRGPSVNVTVTHSFPALAARPMAGGHSRGSPGPVIPSSRSGSPLPGPSNSLMGVSPEVLKYSNSSMRPSTSPFTQRRPARTGPGTGPESGSGTGTGVGTGVGPEARVRPTDVGRPAAEHRVLPKASSQKRLPKLRMPTLATFQALTAPTRPGSSHVLIYRSDLQSLQSQILQLAAMNSEKTSAGPANITAVDSKPLLPRARTPSPPSRNQIRAKIRETDDEFANSP